MMSRAWFRLAAVAVAVAVTALAVVVVAQDPTLQGAARPGLAVGGALSGYDSRWNRGEYIVTADREFNAITSTWYMGLNDFVSDGFVDVVDWAVGRGKLVHGHTLVYPLANVGYWETRPNGSDGRGVRETLRDFVYEAAGVRRGKIWVWDVVNEPFGFRGMDIDEDYLIRDYREYQEMGPEYVDEAFRWAKEADPDAILVLCETHAEEYDERSTKIYDWMLRKRDEGVPIDGIAFHMHTAIESLRTGWEKDVQSIRANFRRFADAGFRLYITEMDVMSTGSATRDHLPTTYQLEEQARVYRSIAELATTMTEIESILFWDYADYRSWLQPSQFVVEPFDTGTYFYPCVYWGGGVGDVLMEKLAYYEFRNGLLTTVALPPPPPPPTPSPATAPAPAPAPVDLERFQNMWNPSNGWLGRHGIQQTDATWLPGNGLGLFERHVGWHSLQWSFEELPAGYGSYRMKCRWREDGGSAFLTRVGEYNQQLQRWEPTNDVTMHTDGYNPDGTPWSSQLWYFEYSSDYAGSWRIINAWDYDTGVLTRDGILTSENPPLYDPGPTVSLHPRRIEWSSQYWRAEEA